MNSKLTRADKENLKKLSGKEGIETQGAYRDRGLLRLQALGLARFVKTKKAFFFTRAGRAAYRGL